MKHFIDTEFLEGPQRKRLFGIPVLGLRWDKNNCLEIYKPYTPNTIDLISIGIVAEDGREYYAISKDFNLKEAWSRYDLEQQSGDMRNVFPEGKKVYWLREKVLKPIWRELFFEADDCSGLSNKQTERFFQDINSGDYDHYFTFDSCKFLIENYGKTNKQIAQDIECFCSMGTAYSSMDKATASIMHFTTLDAEVQKTIEDKDLKFVFNEVPEFYAYYADYDWVVFCWLFGKMIDLPKGFPMYCKDLKQILDNKVEDINSFIIDDSPLVTIKSMKENNPNFPKQDSSKSHNAIEDARWNKQLFEFLTQL